MRLCKLPVQTHLAGHLLYVSHCVDLYSINYMHWGATKTWYGVPGSEAEHFEAVMRASMPELFSMSPDLLFHITTMLSPRVLLEEHVPVYKCDQEARSFIVTFPKAYHAGFSHGFNCGEAVNFGANPHAQLVYSAELLRIHRDCRLATVGRRCNRALQKIWPPCCFQLAKVTDSIC
eukprot:SAG31_NODE_2734_length_5172_cov_2.068007_2_plen_176_part_00